MRRTAYTNETVKVDVMATSLRGLVFYVGISSSSRVARNSDFLVVFVALGCFPKHSQDLCLEFDGRGPDAFRMPHEL